MACKGLRKVVWKCWTTRIRTGNDRTKTCSVTITPSSKNVAAKVRIKIEVPKFCSPNITSRSVSSSSSYPFGPADTYRRSGRQP